jgi:hypothetical protein
MFSPDLWPGEVRIANFRKILANPGQRPGLNPLPKRLGPGKVEGMKTILFAGGIGLLSLVVACAVPPDDKATPEKVEPVKKVPLGKKVSLEIQGKKRTVVIDARVCNRECRLEMLLTGGKNLKEHEAILSAELDAKDVHAALLAAGAEKGKTVDFQAAKPTPPTGTTIKIFLEWKDKQGKEQRVQAQQWIKDAKTKKEMKQDWVFAGSRVVNDPDGKAPPLYMANFGNVICVSNFDDALLDLSVLSSSDNDELVYETWTDRIPPKDTPVRVVLEPVLAKKK